MGSVCEMGRGGLQARSLQFSVMRRLPSPPQPWSSVGWSGARARRLTPACGPPSQSCRPAARHHQPAGPGLANLQKLAETYQEEVLTTCCKRLATVGLASTPPFPHTSALRPSRGSGLTRRLTIL